MPDWRNEVVRRLRGAKLDGAAEHDIADELAQHLEDRYQELIGLGEAPTRARALALDELGESDVFAERLRAVVPARPEPLPIGRPTFSGWIGGLLGDMRFGARMLARAPIYTVVAVLVIALGIGANTVIFTVVNTVLLRPPSGIREPAQLAAVFTSDFSGPRYGSSSYPDVVDLGDATDVFDDVSTYTVRSFSLVGAGWTRTVMGEIVSGNYFQLLGVAPAAGRFFSAEEAEVAASSSVVVIAHAVAQQQFGDVAASLGRTVFVKGEPFTVIGVAPRDFDGSIRGLRMQLWLPFSAPRAVVGGDVSHRGNRGLAVTARLRDGVSLRQAQQFLNVVAGRLHAAYPDEWTDTHDQARVFTIVPESEARVPRTMRGAIIGVLGTLTAAVLVVLLIACTNVANLMLSRASARRAEMGIRIALGATPGRIVRHLVAESVVLALLGGAAGVLLAVWLTRLLNAVQLPGVPVTLNVMVDLRVLAFAGAITLATGILFGLAPALGASRAPAPLIRDDVRGGRRTRIRRVLIVLQVASSLVLLVAGGLVLRSLSAAQRIETGYAADNVVVARFDLSGAGYEAEQAADLYAELLRRVSTLPGTTSHSLAMQAPLGLGYSRRSVLIEGYQPAEDEDMEVPFNLVAPDYFATMGMRLRRGRDFSATDRTGSSPVAIVSESFARRYWPSDDALGRRIALDGPDAPYAEVIGIAPDAKFRSLTDQPQPYMYVPYLQQPLTDMTVMARTAADPDVLAAALRAEIRALAPTLPPTSVYTFREYMALAALPQRAAALLLSGLGLLAVGIAVIGLYGIVAFGVAARTREFGIRMALGAVAGDVRRMVMGEALRLVAIGIACGAPIALALALATRSLLLVPPLDPVPFLGVPVLLGACALLASHAPARRATAQDPAASLRAE